MKILLLGGGGREHALAWKMSLAPQTEKIYVTKGANAGLLSFCEDTGLDAMDGKALAKFVNNFYQDFIYTYAKFLEKVMATHSSTVAWKIPWTEKPGRLQSMGSLGHLPMQET